MKANFMNPEYFRQHPVKAYSYPNASDRKVTLENVVDILLASAITVSIVTIFWFLLALG